MRLLFEIDKKDYSSTDTSVYIRKASRAIIIKKDKIYMAHSKLFDFYKFPGGGVNSEESIIEALIREVKEETGLVVKNDSIKEFGYTIEKNKSTVSDNTIYVQYSYYYLVECEDIIGEQNLDDYEKDYEFELEITTIDNALNKNQIYNETNGKLPYIKREEMVLKLLKENA